MEIWMIKRHEKKKYFSGVYATRIHAIKCLPYLLNKTFKKEKKRLTMLWFSMRKSEVIASGIYRNELYNMYWSIESVDLQTDSDPEELITAQPVTWHDDEAFLQNDTMYDIRLLDGSIVTATFNESDGLFCSNKEEIKIEDVNEFKEVS